MTAWYSGAAAGFLRTPAADIVARLSASALGRYRINETAQLGAWRALVPVVRAVLSAQPAPDEWHVLLEFEIPRLGGRLDAVLLSPRAIFALEFKTGAQGADPAGQAQVDSYALDLRDFHAGSRRHPIVPILVARAGAPPAMTLPLLLAGVTPVVEAGADGLPGVVRALDAQMPAASPLDVAGWERAAYRPVPNVIDAACLLYDGHDVAEIASARADAVNLTLTATRIGQVLAQHREAAARTILFVTGIPGAGKTLCGLNTAFGGGGVAGMTTSFLTGNPTLVHVLREALVRNAAATPRARRLAAHRIEGVIQALPRFRDLYMARPDEVPPEQVVVVDEAQRCWTAAHAVLRTRDRAVPLQRSEPAHLLDIMARRAGFAGLVCLIGTGQEIHDGEGGLAEWGRALAERPEWHVHAPSSVLVATEARNRLPRLPGLAIEPALHLAVPVRSLRHDATPGWVDRVLDGDEAGARRLVETQGEVPFRLTRDLAAPRAGLRAAARDRHRAGLVASAGARRLRAEGLGCELPHMEAEAVARWFLESWRRDRDVRASDALELVATQFSVQGLELDQVGLCWDGDLVREGSGGAWQARSFRGTRWQVARDADKIAWRLNGYRVLLTRARYDTIVWVPRGDADDPSRDPAVLDRVAGFLLGCGARALGGY